VASSDSEVRPRPIIGLPTYVEQTRFGAWDVESSVLPHTYVRMVELAGGIPVLLPPAGTARAELVDRLDGLMLTGGADVDPARYGAAPDACLGPVKPDRDESEFGLFTLARAAGLPILAVCRGLQVANIALGGTLIQHLPDVLGHADHSGTPGGFHPNRVSTVAGSRVAAIAGLEVKVNCHHHQAIDVLAAGLVATAHAADGTIEAAEAVDGTFLLGVQWHPEVDATDYRLVRAVVEAAAGYRRERNS
jgi:putative glutamine amidotransferase